MKSIGFVDLWIDEWHANNYPAWIKKASSELGSDYEVKYVWTELNDGVDSTKTTDEWCKEYGVTKCKTIEELCEKCDNVIVLAPSNPEKHLEYAEKVLKFGKNTYIDKTFAPDYSTALKIYELGKKYNAKFFSTSALRYATELSEYDGNAKAVVTTGTGRTVEEYIIHQIEMVVKCMGLGAEEMRLSSCGTHYVYEIKYAGDRYAHMFYSAYGNVPFTATVQNNDQTSTYYPIASDFFYGLIKDILKFFDDGKLPFKSEQTLEVMRIREAAVKAIEKVEQWVKI